MSACQSFRPVIPFFFLEKVPFLAFLNIERVVVIWTCLRCSLGDADSKYIWVPRSNFKCSSVN